MLKMRTLAILGALFVILIAEKSFHVKALPDQSADAVAQSVAVTDGTPIAKNQTVNPTETTAKAAETTNIQTTKTSTNDLETSGSEQKEQTFVGTPGTLEAPDNAVAGSNYDPTIYGGLLSPEAFQQYVNQFGAPYPYTGATYPAPVYPGYVPPPPPPVYPSPYVVQTGYEGYLVPTTTATSKTTENSSTSNSNPMMVFSNIMSTLMMSTLFKIVATVISAIGMIFFSGAILNIICAYTPICDLSVTAVSYLRRRNTAERMGRLIAEEVTPERVRRAAEFVKNAIKKYHELQHSMGEGENE